MIVITDTVYFKGKPIYYRGILNNNVVILNRKAVIHLIKSRQIENATYANGIRVRGARKIVTEQVVTLYHISFENDNIKMFTPRIPRNKAGKENGDIPRVCLSDSIAGAIAAIPDGADMVGNEPISSYKIQISVHESGILSWKELYTKGMVPDSKITHEFWCRERLIMSPSEIVITSYTDTYKYVVTEADKYRVYNELVRILPKAVYAIPHIKEYELDKFVNELINLPKYNEMKNVVGEIMDILDIESILYLSNLKYKTVD